MNKENLNYSISGLKTIFDRISKHPATEKSPMFSVWVDGLEVVPVTNHFDRLFDFMVFDFDCCQTLTVYVFDASGNIAHSYEMKMPGHLRFEKTEHETAHRLEMAEAENKRLKRELKKQQRTKHFEKPQDIKVIDAGNMLVLFVDKDKISESMNEQLSALESSAKMTKQAIRIFNRFVNKKEKE